MPNLRTLCLTCLTLVGAKLDRTLPGQDVVLSEIAPDAAGAWIELHNRGATPADVSAWALYLATATPTWPGNYWWGFRPGTVIPPGGYLLVRWLEPLPPVPVPNEVSTGATNPYFLFGLGAEPLPLQHGAVALLRTQRNGEMNTAASFVDWVRWGNGALLREDIATAAGLWAADAAAPPLRPGASLARHPGSAVPGHPELAWFVDATPTPLADNVGAADLTPLGTPCAPLGHHLLGLPELRAASQPVIGNADFGLQITNTTGVLLEHCLLVFSSQPLPTGLHGLLPSAAGDVDCLVHVDPAFAFATDWRHSAMLATHVPLPLDSLPASMAGARFTVQALVFDFWATAWPPYQGLTNALVVTLGS